jgi:hypothetical protein
VVLDEFNIGKTLLLHIQIDFKVIFVKHVYTSSCMCYIRVRVGKSERRVRVFRKVPSCCSDTKNCAINTVNNSSLCMRYVSAFRITLLYFQSM